MASSDWDASSGDEATPVTTKAPAAATQAPTSNVIPGYGRKKFDDEDVEDDIKDDWDAEDEEPVKPDVSMLAPIKKKGTVKQKIQEREERDRRRAELGLGSDEEDESEDDLSPAERKRLEREAQIKADVENAANLLGTSKISNSTSSGSVLDTSLKPTKLSTKEDWESFSDNLYKQLIKQHSTKPGFDKNFIPHFTKLLSENLRDVDCRKQSSTWKTIADEKTRLEKEKKSGGGIVKTVKGAKPKTVGTASAKNTYDLRAYGDEALDDGDDLDFM